MTKDIRISVHMLAKEDTALGHMMFKAAVQAVLGTQYAHQLVIVDNGCSPDIIGDIEKTVGQYSLTSVEIVKDGAKDFAALRNRCLDLTADECTHFHWIDTDEVYPESSLQRIKEIAVKHDPAAIMSYFTHFMIDPVTWQMQQEKTNFYKLHSGIRWELPVHEHLVGYDKKNVKASNAHYLHFGYIRPQWIQALKWLRYMVWEKGNANHYREYYDDGWKKVVAYYSDTRNPNQCLEDRRDYCQKYTGKYPPAFLINLMDPWASSRLTWDGWLEKVMSKEWEFWRQWQVKRTELGSWKDTIGWACEQMGLQEKQS